MTRPRGCRAGRPPESPSPAPGDPSDDTTVAAAGRPAAFASLRDSRRPVARYGVAAFLLCSGALLAPTWANAQTAPTITSVDFTSDAGADDTYGLGDEIEVTLTFSEAVTVVGLTQTSGVMLLQVDVGGQTRSAFYATGSGTDKLVFTFTVDEDDEDTDGIAVKENTLTHGFFISIKGGGGTGADAVLNHDAKEGGSEHKVDGSQAETDTTPPALESATVAADGTSITLVFDEPYTYEGAIGIVTMDISVSADGSAVTAWQKVLVQDADFKYRTFRFRLSPAITHGQVVTVSYADPAGDDTTAVFQDAAGNDVASFTTGSGGSPAVVNNSLVTINTPPEFPESIPDVSMPENSAPGLDIGDPVVATDADGDTLTYSLLQGAGTDGSSFDIVPSTGQLRTRSGVTYSYEAKRTLIVQVRVDDANGGTDAVFVQIELTDVDEPPLAPDPPTVSPVSGSSDSLSVSWTAPDNTGKPDIDSYDLQYRKGTSGPFTDGPQAVADTMATIDGLDANASYQVRVRATNDEGDGPWSSAGTGSTSADTTPPTLTSGEADFGGTVRLTFNEDLDLDNLPPASAITLTVDGSRVLFDFLGGGNEDNEVVLNLPDLPIRQGQTVVVTYIDPTAGDDAVALQDAAGNDVANFTATLENNSTVTPAAPGPPTGLGATAAGQTRIDLAWTAPADNGGRAISGYRIEWSGDGSDPWAELVANTGSTGTSYADTSLAAGTTRHYRVAAINTVGTGSASASASATTTTATPGPPQNLQATAGTGKVTLAWQAPASEGASAITHYEYQRKEGSGSFGTWTTAETVAFGTNSSSAILRDATTLDHYDVRAETTYTYRVRAVNAAGNGGASGEDSATTGAAMTVKVVVAEPNVAENEGPVPVTVVAELPATGANEEKYELEFTVGGFNDRGTASGIDGDYVGLTPLLTFTPGDFPDGVRPLGRLRAVHRHAHRRRGR